MAELAAGNYDAMISRDIGKGNSWDVAAGYCLLKANDFVVLDRNLQPFDYHNAQNWLVAIRREIASTIIEELQAYDAKEEEPAPPSFFSIFIKGYAKNNYRSIFDWFRRSDRLTKDAFLRYGDAEPDESREFRFLIDTKKRKIIFCEKASHVESAARYLGLPKEEVTTTTASHLTGATMTVTKDLAANALIGATSMTRSQKIGYSDEILEKAKAILEDYLKLSDLPLKSYSIKTTKR